MKKYKKRADGRYSTQIMLGYRDNGKRIVKTLYGRTIQELSKKEVDFRNKLNNGMLLANENITVGEWADIWIKTFKISISHNTHVRYECIISKHIKPMIGYLPISKVKIHHIQGMINELSNTLSPSTIKKIKQVLHQIFEQAVRQQYIHLNPVDGIETPALKQKERAIIPTNDVMRITEFCKTYKHGDLIMTLLYTGLRRGEILALTKNDIDMEKGYLTVNKAVEFIGEKPNIKEPKTPKSNRYIPILDPLKPYLTKLLENDSKWLFCDSDGNLYTKSSIEYLSRDFNKKYNEYINTGKKDSELENVHFTLHQFRHTFCTLLYKAGVDLKTSQEIMGHSSVSVTLGIYTHLDNELRQINADKINAYIKSQSEVSRGA